MSGSMELERIENGVVAGTPDVHVLCRGGLSAWVELKAVATWPLRANSMVLCEERGLSIAQRNWFLRATQLGFRRAYILVGVGSRGVYMFPGVVADRVNSFTRQQFFEHAIAQDWTQVDAILREGRK